LGIPNGSRLNCCVGKVRQDAICDSAEQSVSIKENAIYVETGIDTIRATAGSCVAQCDGLNALKHTVRDSCAVNVRLPLVSDVLEGE
jgi:hypothetical protein